MKEENLNPLILKMAKDLMKVKTSLPLSVAVATANYRCASIAGQLKVMIDTKSGFGATPANLYSLVLAGSGVGKNSSLILIDRFYFKDAFDYMSNSVYPQFKKKALAQLESDGNERTIHSWAKSLSNATDSGLLAYAESYFLCGVGSICLELDEVSNSILSKADLFTSCLSPYDNGDFSPVGKRSDSDALNITGLSLNLFAFGNTERLFSGDLVEHNFRKLLAEGYSRRLIFAEDNVAASIRTTEEIIQEMDSSESIAKERETDRVYIKSLLSIKNMNKVIPLSREAFIMFASIKAEGDVLLSKNKGLAQSAKIDIAERNFKTAKLAGIYAFMEEKDEVSKTHMMQAFEVVQDSSKVLQRITIEIPQHERLLEAILLEEKPCTAQHFLSYPFIPSSWTRKIEELLVLAKELSSDRGYIWTTTVRNGVDYYEVKAKDIKRERILKEVDDKEKKEVIKRKMTEQELIDFLN